MTPQIAVIVPVYNRRDLVVRTLDSIRRQTYRPLSLIIVDNNSTDDTLDVVCDWAAEATEDPTLQVKVLTQRRPGAAAARNAGLKAADTEWVMFFDSDDIMAPTHVADAMACAADVPNVDIVGWDVHVHELDGRTTIKPFADEDKLYNCVIHGSMSTLRYMVVRHTLLTAGGWDENVRVWDDIELGTRLLCLPHVKIVKRTTPITVEVQAQEKSITGTGYSSRAADFEHAIECMARNMHAKYMPIINLKRTMLAAAYYREGRPELAKRLMDRTLKSTDTPRRKMLLRLAYRYAKTGARGIVRLLKPFFNV